MAEATPATVPVPGTGPSAPQSAAAPKVEHYRDGKLTRAGMEHAIKNHGSVLHNGVVISSVDKLPSEAELAKGDSAAEAAALDNINRQRAALDAQEAALKKPAPAPAKK